MGGQKRFRLSVRLFCELFWSVLLFVLDMKMTFGTTHFYFFFGLFVWLSLLALQDLRYYAYSARLFYLPAIFFCIVKKDIFFSSWQIDLFVSFIFSLFFLALIKGCNRLYQKESMGEGDWLLLTVLAFLFGLEAVCQIILYSSFLALLFFKQERLPFVPFILIGTFLMLCISIPLF